MVCYSIPVAAAIIHFISRKKITGLKNNVHHLWLNLLLAGGAIFGVVDHLWNGELFLIGEAPLMDLLLGVAITVMIFVVWLIFTSFDKMKMQTPTKSVK